MSATQTIDWNKYADTQAAAPQIDFSKYEGNQDAGGAAKVSAGDGTGIWAGVKRNTVGMVTGLYHAFADPATEQEKTDLLKKVKEQNANGDDIPESLATNPSRATLAYHRLIDAPADQLELKGHNERAAAKDLLSHGEIAKGANTYLSGLTDTGLSAVPLAGPWINSVAERAEKGDVSGAATDIAAALAAPHIAKGIPKVLAIPLSDSVRQAIAEQVSGPIVRKTPTQTANDLKFGRSPAEAITREPGLEGFTPTGLRAGVVKRMGEIGQVIDQTLSTPQATQHIIDIEPIIDQAAKDAKASPTAKLNPTFRDRIDDLSNNLKNEWGSLQKNPLEATQMKRDIGSATKWNGLPFDNEANQFLVDIYRGIKNEVNAKVPEVKAFNERYADLLSAKTALDRRIAFNVNRPLSIGRALLGVGGGAAGTVAGGALGGFGGAAAGLAIDAFRSDPVRITTGKLLGSKYPFPAAPSPSVAATGTGTGVTSPITGAPLATPAQLFKTGTNP